MNVKQVVAKLKKKYPGKKVIVEDDGEFQEILCELEPTKDHPERSLALAVVGKSKPHYHKKSTEIYEAVKGMLIVYIKDEKHVLKPGEKLEIKPGDVHWAEDDEAWFKTYSNPGWTFEDHIIVSGE